MRNGFWLGLVLLAVHLAVCGGIWLLAWAKVLEVEGYFAPVMLLVPLWGPLCVLLLHTSNRLTGGCLREQTLEKLHINEEIHKSILVADDEGEDMVVPLEEALLVDSPAQKRKLILSVLTDDPAGYYDLLQQARMDNDSEVVHYASTALSQITKEADLKLQKLEQRYAAAPDDAAVLEEYCNYLESYLKDGFVQGRAAEIQRHQLEQLLKKRLENLGGRRSCTLECRLADVQLSLADGWVDIGAVVRLAPIKDVKTMIYAFFELASRVPNVRLHIMGGVDDEDYAKECYALVEELQLKNLIFTGRVDVVQYMQKLDFTILTSISEGQPLSVLESMAARRPCVTTEVGCCRELLEGAPGDTFGIAGYCVPPMYRQGLADAMEKMCASRTRREEMGRIGQRRVDAYFHHEQMLANYRKMYDETAKEYHLE